MAKGTKRGSPGAEDEKNPLESVELSEEDAVKLQEVQREIARVELVLGVCFGWIAQEGTDVECN